MKERNNKLLRFCDTYVGVPLIFILGLLRMKRRFPAYLRNKKNPRIVLLKTAGIGDTVLASAIIRELRHVFPGSHITLICTSANRPAAEMIAEIDQIVVFKPARPFDSFRLVRGLARFDLLFDLGPWPRVNSLISCLIKSSFKVGFKRMGMFRHCIYDSFVEHTDRNHEIDNYRNLLRRAGINPSGIDPRLRIYGRLLQKHKQYFSETAPNIILHPFPAGSKGHLREWPAERWAELGIRMADDGYNIMISGGKEDISRAEGIVKIIQAHGRACTSITGKMNLREMAIALRESDLLIATDTGIMHLGAAVGTPLVALFGPSRPDRWGPRPQANATIVTQTTSCKPCLSLGFEDQCRKSCGCMESITVDMVYNAALRSLDCAPKRPSRIDRVLQSSVEL